MEGNKVFPVPDDQPPEVGFNAESFSDLIVFNTTNDGNQMDNCFNHKGLVEQFKGGYSEDDSNLKSNEPTLELDLASGSIEIQRTATNGGGAQSIESSDSPFQSTQANINVDKLGECIRLTYHHEQVEVVDPTAKSELCNFIKTITYDMRVFDCLFKGLEPIHQQNLIHYFENLSSSKLSQNILELTGQTTGFDTAGWTQIDHSEFNKDTTTIETTTIATTTSPPPLQGSSESFVKPDKKKSKSTVNKRKSVKSIENNSSDTITRTMVNKRRATESRGHLVKKRKEDNAGNVDANDPSLETGIKSGEEEEEEEEEEEVEARSISIAYNNWQPLFPTIKPSQRPEPPSKSEAQIEILKRHLAACDAPPPPTTNQNSCSWYLQKFMHGLTRIFFQNVYIATKFIPLMIQFIASKPKKTTFETWRKLQDSDTKVVERAWRRINGFNQMTSDEEALTRFKSKLTLALTIDNRKESSNRWTSIHYQEFGYLIRRFILQVADTLGVERPINYDLNYRNWAIKYLDVKPEKFKDWFKKKLPSLHFPQETETVNKKLLPDVNWTETIEYYKKHFDRILDLDYDHSRLRTNPHSYYNWCKMGKIAFYDWMEENENNVLIEDKDYEGNQFELANQSPIQNSNDIIQVPEGFQLPLIKGGESDHQVINVFQENQEQYHTQDSKDFPACNQNNQNSKPEDFNPYEFLPIGGNDTPAVTLSQEIRQITHNNMIDECLSRLNTIVPMEMNPGPEVLFYDEELQFIGLPDPNIGEGNNYNW